MVRLSVSLSVKAVGFVAAVLAWLPTSAAITIAANDQTAGKREVEAIVRAFYSKTIRQLEHPRGREALRKSCDYLQSVFEEIMLKNDKFGCDAKGGGYFRFPGASSEEISEFGNDGILPGFRIIESSARGQTAIVKVQAPIIEGRVPSRVVYYFRKTDGRWKVSNLLTYDQWPLDTNQEGGCRYVSGYYGFALPPKTEADLEDLPPLCKALELDNMRSSGSGSPQQKSK